MNKKNLFLTLGLGLSILLLGACGTPAVEEDLQDPFLDDPIMEDEMMMEEEMIPLDEEMEMEEEMMMIE